MHLHETLLHQLLAADFLQTVVLILDQLLSVVGFLLLLRQLWLSVRFRGFLSHRRSSGSSNVLSPHIHGQLILFVDLSSILLFLPRFLPFSLPFPLFACLLLFLFDRIVYLFVLAELLDVRLPVEITYFRFDLLEFFGFEFDRLFDGQQVLVLEGKGLLVWVLLLGWDWWRLLMGWNTLRRGGGSRLIGWRSSLIAVHLLTDIVGLLLLFVFVGCFRLIWVNLLICICILYLFLLFHHLFRDDLLRLI